MLWLACLSIGGSRDYRVLGTDLTEYQRVFSSTFVCFSVVAIASLAFKIDFARGYLLIAMPVGLIALLIERKLWRTWLVRQRVSNKSLSQNVVVIGAGDRVSRVVRELLRAPAAGYQVVGVALKPGHQLDADLQHLNLPVGCIDDAVEFMRSVGGDTIAVSSGSLPGPEIQQISWQLVSGTEHLIVSPALLDVAGPRISMRPVAGLSLIHVETPRITGWRKAVKATMDYVGAAIIVVIILPILLIIALAVKLTSPGPVLFKQERVGRDGRTFKMLKFRSMVVDAEAKLDALKGQQVDKGNVVMFKMADDPRITGCGKFLRRYSLDELPQLFNVLRGEMSLIGPRPPLLSEVEEYESNVHRRFLVKPGLTGLWQVSGRSELSWDDTVRLDLYYVANWSVTQDMQILLKTVGAVLARQGAY